MYRAGHIRVLVSTSTLAYGVNFPSHTVIIKSTEVKSIIISAQNPTTRFLLKRAIELSIKIQIFQAYREKGTEEIQESMIVQMIGRAGRAPFEEHGKAYILTRREHVVSILRILIKKNGS